MHSISRLAALLLVASGLALLPLVTADPALGLRAAPAAPPACTINGTPGADELEGTRGSDVICGLGGDDRLSGGDGRDVLRGGEGDDVLDGSKGNDRLSGGPGHDTLVDDEGRNVMRGGPGNDRLASDYFNDVLYGGSGNDDLDGGAGKDRLYGGTGTNICTITSELVTAVGCTPDQGPPVADSFTVTGTTFDVTDSSPRRNLRVHITDDTGTLPYLRVRLVRDDGAEEYGYGFVERVEGTDRDGWYAGYYQAHAFGDPGTGHLELRVSDRGNRSADVTGASVEVVNQDPDLAAPTAELLLPAADAEVTVPTPDGDDVDVLVRARIEDDASGTDYVYATLYHRSDGEWQYYTSSHLRRQDGSDRGDGVYLGCLSLDDDAPTGVWNVTIDTGDLRERYATYAGPGVYAERSPRDGLFPLPGGAGRFTVTRP